MRLNFKETVWEISICPRCGGKAIMGLLSLIARCEDCGAKNLDNDYWGKPIDWTMPTSEGAD